MQKQVIVFRKFLAALLCFAAIASTSETVKAGEKEAIVSHSADMLTTAVGLNQGLVELNPLGPLVIAGKVVAYRHFKAQPEAEQPRLWNMFSAVGWGATANNICAIATGGIGCIVLGAVTGYARFHQAEETRMKAEFDLICEKEKQRLPNLVCTYK